jgi:PAS domain S-box-containing protein
MRLGRHDEIGEMACLLRDLLERLEQSSKHSEQLTAFIAEAPVAIAMFDRDMRYRAASRRWMEDYGLSGSVIGRGHYEIFPDIPEGWKEVHRRGFAGEVVKQDEDGFEREDGSTLWLRWEVRPLYGADGTVDGIVIFTEDITPRKTAEQERDASIRALENSNHEFDEFAHMTAHDLKEPLRGLRNQISFLEEDFGDHLPQEGKARLARMATLGTRMQRLIEDLLFYARLGRAELAVQLADPNQMICDVREMLEGLLTERNVEIAVPRKMAPMLCDKTRVTEVFRNLITNAIKNNDKENPLIEIGQLPAIRVGATVEKGVFYVKDNGIGIAPESHDEIFRMFRRVANDKSAGVEGTGAGLAFVKRIVERHGGHIWLESVPGEGTTFYFTLSRAPASSPKMAATACGQAM